MSSSEQQQNYEKQVVAVTSHGQATIPKRFREKLGIDAPGKVLFRETEDGSVVVEQVPSPGEMRRFAAQTEAASDEPATEILREKRDQDRSEREEQFSSEK